MADITLPVLRGAAYGLRQSLETVTPCKFSVEGEAGLESDERMEQTLGGSAIEVVAKASRRRFTVEYKRKIVYAFWVSYLAETQLSLKRLGRPPSGRGDLRESAKRKILVENPAGGMTHA